ncbi:hypothetical protein PENTCL1PPCAC_26829, partial [Pristionchus entomophagus]
AFQYSAMSKDESILSSISGPGSSGGTQAHLVKVLANVVETQKSVASQFAALFDRVEEARNETRRNIAALTDEIKKLEIRSSTMFEKVTTQLMAQNDALSAAHAAERSQLITQNESILSIIKATVCNAAPRPAPVHSQPMQAFNQAMTANAMFGGISNQDQQLMDQFNQLTPNQIGALQAQMRQLQIQQQLQQQQQHQAMLARAAASSTSIAAPSQMPSVPTAAVPAIPVIPAATPAAPTPAVVTQPAAPKVEVKPVIPTPTPASASVAAKPLFSFGSPAGASSTTAKPLFGGSMAPSVAPAATTAGAAAPISTFSFVAPKPTPKAEVKEEPADDENDEDHVEEYEPDVDFAPVIPLPDMVETVTGEESEKVLLEDRCKLFRFTNGEWKERATGNIKVLKNEKAGKHRVVVRRDQVHKVAANFNLAPGVKVASMKNNQKAVVWFCVDFSEDEVTGVNEQLSAKFSSPQQAEEFMELINSIVDAMPKSGATPKKPVASKTEGAKVEIPKTEEPKKSAVVAPSAAPAVVSTGFGDKFKMTAGEWECAACYVRNTADAAECSCCGTANPKSEKKESDKNPFGKNATIFNPAAASGSTTKFSFGMGGGGTSSPAPVSTTTTETKTSAPSASGLSFGSSATTTTAPSTATTAAPKFSFMQAAAAASKEDEKKPPLFGSSGAPSVVSAAFGGGVTPTPSGSSTFSFKAAPTPSSSSSSTATATPSALPAFSFKTPDPSKPTSIFGGSQKTLFGTSNPATPVDTMKPEEEKKETPGTVFGSSFMSGGQSTSAGFSGLTGKPSIFEQQDKVAEGQKNFANLAKSKPFGQSAAVTAAVAPAASSKDEDGEEGDPEEYEPDVQFAPVVPLPDLVEVKTGEEDEKVLFTARSKIFRYVRETKEFKERGVGDLKLLHNEGSNKFRVVMRRDQVHKLCANFSVLKNSNLVEKAGQSNVRSIVVTDFAENDAGDMESLCIKFKNAEIAKEFERAFQDAQARLQ